MTGAFFTIGINPNSGVIFFLNVRSAQKAAADVWQNPNPPKDELPALRTTSDMAWGFHNRVNFGNLGNVRALMSCMITNGETDQIIEQVLEKYNANLRPGQSMVWGVPPWPGLTFSTNDEEGQALLGE